MGLKRIGFAGVALLLACGSDGITIRDLTIDGGWQAIRFDMALGTIDGTTLDPVEMSSQSYEPGQRIRNGEVSRPTI